MKLVEHIRLVNVLTLTQAINDGGEMTSAFTSDSIMKKYKF